MVLFAHTSDLPSIGISLIPSFLRPISCKKQLYNYVKINWSWVKNSENKNVRKQKRPKTKMSENKNVQKQKCPKTKTYENKMSKNKISETPMSELKPNPNVSNQNVLS
jgi:hypothetical protein